MGNSILTSSEMSQSQSIHGMSTNTEVKSMPLTNTAEGNNDMAKQTSVRENMNLFNKIASTKIVTPSTSQEPEIEQLKNNTNKLLKFYKSVSEEENNKNS